MSKERGIFERMGKENRSWQLKTLILSLCVGVAAALFVVVACWLAEISIAIGILLSLPIFMIMTLTIFLFKMAKRLDSREVFFKNVVWVIWSDPFLGRELEALNPRDKDFPEAVTGLVGKAIKQLEEQRKENRKLLEERDQIATAARDLVILLFKEIIRPIWENKGAKFVLELGEATRRQQLLSAVAIGTIEKLPVYVMPDNIVIRLFGGDLNLMQDALKRAINWGKIRPGGRLTRLSQPWIPSPGAPAADEPLVDGLPPRA